MPESWKTRIMRWGFNLYPAYRGTGAYIAYIADDFHEVRIQLPLNWLTRNYVGTLYGGSMYGAVDPIYMLMLIKRLGQDYLVWDKAATIYFKKPGRTTLYATFVVDDQEVQKIQAELSDKSKMDRIYNVDLIDQQGVVHATVQKMIYIRRKD